MTASHLRPKEVARAPSLLNVMLIELRCMLRTLVMLAAGKIEMPGRERGRTITFSDGSSSRIYRETTLIAGRSVDPVLLVVRFRLRLIGTNRLAHALFRFESLFNTVLFAAHRGFRTKLWLTDLTTGFYRGVYEWDGLDSATEYAEVLRVVLRPWVEKDSFAYRFLERFDRDSYLDGQVDGVAENESAMLWWLPVPSSR